MSDLKKLIDDYLKKLRDIANQPDASSELSFRPALNLLLDGLSSAMGKCSFDLVPLTEPQRKSFGSPDYKIKTSKDLLVGYVEAKRLDADLKEYENSEQMNRYKSSGQRILLTNHLEFILFDTNSSNGNKTIHRVDSIRLLNTKDLMEKKAPDISSIEALDLLLDRFLREARPDIGTPKELAERLAYIAHHIRDLMRDTYADEDDKGELHSMKNAFEKTLIPDLTPEQFTDMYAQTITYGLFAARCNHSSPEPFSLDTAWKDIPKTNPFLRYLFYSVTGNALEGKPYRWIIEDLAHTLAAIDLEAILKDFGRRTRQEDPIVHFYETFLAAYDPRLREKRGVYYTPEPVVSYIVRSVDYMLKERFGCPDGLADTATVDITIKDEAAEEKKEERHRVLVLDPACGTGTFLYAIIDHIRDWFMKQNNAGMWSDYVKKHILPRIFGFELLMAPYAVAHLKLGMQLAGQDLTEKQRKNWAYDFKDEERLNIYLTNSLEEIEKKPYFEYILAKNIVEEGEAATHVKHTLPIMVVLGNPPYSGISANNGEWIRDLIQEYYFVDSKPLGERNPKWLQDDYVKFIRFGQWRIQQTGVGILALITNHGYLDNPTFRGMRQQLIHSFTDIYILDLHGNAKKKEKCPDGNEDKNVFDIQQGVAIAIFVKEKGKSSPAKVHHTDLWGTREAKYQFLKENSFKTTSWEELNPHSPFYFLIPQDTKLEVEFNQWRKITDVMPVNGVGMTTARDHIVIDFKKETILERAYQFRNSKDSDAETCNKLSIPLKKGWNIANARKLIKKENNLEQFIKPILYRPFDNRLIFYHDSLVWRTVKQIMSHIMAGENLSLNIGRAGQVVGGNKWNILYCSCLIEDFNLFYRGGNVNFPLYLYSDSQKQRTLFMTEPWPAGKDGRRPNLDPAFIKDVEARIGMTFITDGLGDLEETFGPEDIFHYIYAVFHSPTYRNRYAEYLKRDFPRVPVTSDSDLFRTLCAKGADLVALHLMEDNYPAASWKENIKDSPLQNTFTSFPVSGDSIVEKPIYKAPAEKVPDEDFPLTSGRVYINKAKSEEGKKAQYFDNVPPEVWEFHIGGYQVCQKWLKDRKGRALSYEDIRHYQRIVVALKETIRLMDEIDDVIPSWPIK